MNRAQRRAIQRSESKKNMRLAAEYARSVNALSSNERIASLVQNGITPKDVKAEYERGRNEGAVEAGLSITKCCYAAMILVLQEQFSFNNDQCYEAVMALDDKIVYAIDHADMSDEVLEKTGIFLNLDSAIDRVERTDQPHD